MHADPVDADLEAFRVEVVDVDVAVGAVVDDVLDVEHRVVAVEGAPDVGQGRERSVVAAKRRQALVIRLGGAEVRSRVCMGPGRRARVPSERVLCRADCSTRDELADRE